jgi:hypothetical protein
MSIELKETGISPDVMADLEATCRYAASGVRDSEVMRRACERMDRTREELRQKCGVIDDETFQALLGDDDEP